MRFFKTVNALKFFALVTGELGEVLSFVLPQKECITARALDHILSCHFVQFKSSPTQVIELIGIKYFLHDVVSSLVPSLCFKCLLAMLQLG